MQCTCCNSSENYFLGKKNNYSLFVCKNCGFEFVYPLPDILELENFYNQGMNKGIDERIKTAIEDLDNNPNHPHRDWFISIINKVVRISGKKKLKILEIGSSMGSFVHIANKMGHNATGTEISEETANASKGVIMGQIIYTGSKKYDDVFRDEKFDLIYMEHVLEHLVNPEEIIRQISDLLDKHGILVISVPNQKSWMAKLYGINWDWISPPLHLQYFNKHNIGLLVKKYNLEITRFWTGEYFFRSIYQFFILPLFLHRLKQISNKIFKTKFITEYKFQYLYKYPRKPMEFINILPYFILYPLIKSFSFFGMGNDMTVFVQKKAN